MIALALLLSSSVVSAQTIEYDFSWLPEPKKKEERSKDDPYESLSGLERCEDYGDCE